MRSIAVSDQQRRSRRSRRTIWIPVLICGVGLGAAGLLAARGHLASLLAERDARRAMARGQWSDASAALARWLALRPDSAEAHFLKAKVAFEQGRFSDVAPSVDRAQWLGYPERPLYRLRALVLVRLRQFIEAEPILLHLVDESAAPDPQVDEALNPSVPGNLSTGERDHGDPAMDP